MVPCWIRYSERSSRDKKHPRRWEITESQIPSVKIWFKTNTKGHKHPSIRLFITKQYRIGKRKKKKSGIQPRNRELHPPLPLWWGADSPILNYTPGVCIYTSYNRTRIKNAYVYIYIYIYTYIYIYILRQSFWTGTKIITSRRWDNASAFYHVSKMDPKSILTISWISKCFIEVMF